MGRGVERRRLERVPGERHLRRGDRPPTARPSSRRAAAGRRSRASSPFAAANRRSTRCCGIGALPDRRAPALSCAGTRRYTRRRRRRASGPGIPMTRCTVSARLPGPACASRPSRPCSRRGASRAGAVPRWSARTARSPPPTDRRAPPTARSPLSSTGSAVAIDPTELPLELRQVRRRYPVTLYVVADCARATARARCCANAAFRMPSASSSPRGR